MQPHPDQVARMRQLTSRLKTNEKPIELRVKKLHEDAIIPTRSNQTDAGWDLYSTERVGMIPMRQVLVSTGIALAIPEGYVGLIWPRSGLAVKRGIDVYAGVIDSGYRGEIKVCLYTNSVDPNWGTPKAFDIEKGDRIAQIIFQKIEPFKLIETQELDDTDRGADGFGSSGA
jgi:dUTP pyrophosphatase